MYTKTIVHLSVGKERYYIYLAARQISTSIPSSSRQSQRKTLELLPFRANLLCAHTNLYNLDPCNTTALLAKVTFRHWSHLELGLPAGQGVSLPKADDVLTPQPSTQAFSSRSLDSTWCEMS